MKKRTWLLAFALILSFILPLLLTGCVVDEGIAGVYENEQVTLTLAKDKTLRLRSGYCVVLGNYYVDDNKLMVTMNGISKGIPFSQNDDTLILTFDQQILQELAAGFTTADYAAILNGSVKNYSATNNFTSVAGAALGSAAQYNTLLRSGKAPETASFSNKGVALPGTFELDNSSAGGSAFSFVDMFITWNALTFVPNGELQGHTGWGSNKDVVGTYSLNGNELTYTVENESNSYQVEISDDELVLFCGNAGIVYRRTSQVQSIPTQMDLPDDEAITYRMLNEDTLAITGKGILSVDSTNLPWRDYANQVKNIVIGDSITEIDHASFSTFNNLRGVTIGKNVKSLGAGAFNWCVNLTEITLPESLISIGERAFRNCYSLVDIYYGGTENQWNEIQIDSDNDELQNVRIHCSDTEFMYSSLQSSVQQESAPAQNTYSNEQIPAGKKRVYTKYNRGNFSMLIPEDWTAKTETVTEMWDTPQTSDQFRCYDASGNLVLDFDYQTSGVGVPQTEITLDNVKFGYGLGGDYISGVDNERGSHHILIQHGLSLDEITELFSTIEFLGAAETYTYPSQILDQGAYGDEVRYVQSALMEMNYDGIVIDGEYGQYTKDAVARFQKNHNLEPTGIVDAATVQEIQSALAVWRQ